MTSTVEPRPVETVDPSVLVNQQGGAGSNPAAFEATLAQATNQGDSGWYDVADVIGDAANAAIDRLPPTAQGLAGVLKNTPPDAMVLGGYLNTPVGKAGLFLIQPTLPANPLLPDLSKAPTVFVSIPGTNTVATYNPNNNQVEFGPGSGHQIAPDTLAFYNARVGGRGINPGSGPHDVSSVSVNFGVINSTLSDPIADKAIDLASHGAAKALTAIAAALDIATIPSGEGVAAAVGIEAARRFISTGLQNNTEFYAGFAWRGADLETYANGERTLSISGADIRINEGEGPGGSGRSSEDFDLDIPSL